MSLRSFVSLVRRLDRSTRFCIDARFYFSKFFESRWSRLNTCIIKKVSIFNRFNLFRFFRVYKIRVIKCVCSRSCKCPRASVRCADSVRMCWKLNFLWYDYINRRLHIRGRAKRPLARFVQTQYCAIRLNLVGSLRSGVFCFSQKNMTHMLLHRKVAEKRETERSRDTSRGLLADKLHKNEFFLIL